MAKQGLTHAARIDLYNGAGFAPQEIQTLRADISNAGEGVDWHISVSQDNISVSQGQSYDVVFWAKGSAGTVLATTTLDQSLAGDQWHRVASVALRAADHPVVRVHSDGAGTLNADALLVQSTARYNDGSAATSIELDAMDAILLRRTGAEGCP